MSQSIISMPHGDWLGNDGNWSTIQVAIGLENMGVHLLPSTSLSDISAVHGSGCSKYYLLCAAKRGGVYQPSASTSWSLLGLYRVGLEYLGFNITGQYGTDNMYMIDGAKAITFTVPHVLTSTFSSTNLFLGTFGLGIQQREFGNTTIDSTLTGILQAGYTSSYSYGYTAGAHYRNIPSSLTIGGYDSARLIPHDIDFVLHQDGSLQADVHAVQALQQRGAKGVSISDNSQTFSALIDSTTPYLWLPAHACNAIAANFNLIYNDTLELYTISNTQYRDYSTSLEDTIMFIPSFQPLDIHLPELSPPMMTLQYREDTYFGLERDRQSRRLSPRRGYLLRPRRQEPIPSVLNTQLTSPPIPTESQQQNIIYIKKKPTLPDPKLFDGNRRNFQVWQLEMESKLRVDGPALGNSADQFAYIYTRLDQTPQSLAAAYFKKGGSNGSHNPVEFMAYLVSCYGDRHLKQKALNRLETMRQNNKESFAAFLPRFERELADSGGYNWDDEIKINSLRRVINQEMEGHLISQLALPTVYPDFVNTLQSLGANIEGYHFRNHKLRYQSSYQQNPYPKESNSNYHPNQPRREQPQQNNQSATGSNQMDWEPTKAGKLRSNKQRKQPKYAPECYNCGNLGHIARYCKTNRKGKQESQPETRIAKGKSKKTLSREEDDDLGGSDDSNSEYESGNE
ncbi:hypothetical protein VHEMI08509 [[Torrubiella] hemipterigena]|uniref:CCHC-type domain-containing protein n=1 Tax=[Torrubiella] hemipterigena TaxID=1531966 RepID=A0A0A1T6X2_9HYPO|nr:hypothetical protein VHEMI08509 [[Torrubiella] hemipterigena]